MLTVEYCLNKSMNINDIKNNNKTIFNAWLHIPSPFGAEIIAKQGWDSITIDMLHGLITHSDALAILHAISSTNTIPLIRVPSNNSTDITKCLDMGAKGIITPMIDNASQAQEFVDACVFPPIGKRSFGPIRAYYTEDKDYILNSHNKVLKIIQIESKSAYENLDSILSVEHLDGVYIGPNDLALGLGTNRQIDTKNPQRANEFQITDETMDAIEHILKKTKEYGLIAGIHSTSEQITALMIEKGFQMVTATSDERLLASGSQNMLKNLKK